MGEDRGVIIEKANDSTKFTFFDNDGKEILVRSIPGNGMIFDRR